YTARSDSPKAKKAKIRLCDHPKEARGESKLRFNTHYLWPCHLVHGELVCRSRLYSWGLQVKAQTVPTSTDYMDLLPPPIQQKLWLVASWCMDL
ncbi:MAG: hypothetical protein MI674_01540, partial [Cytophagales bacterium]|nr:hypothetical protein [Cytophagales bacterium]